MRACLRLKRLRKYRETSPTNDIPTDVNNLPNLRASVTLLECAEKTPTTIKIRLREFKQKTDEYQLRTKATNSNDNAKRKVKAQVETVLTGFNVS